MITLNDGPAKGTYYAARAPVYLRAVSKEDAPANARSNGCDVLDQIDDAPEPGESVHVYFRIDEPGSIIMCGRGFGSSGIYATATYIHVQDADGEQLRENALWQDWARRRYNNIFSRK